MNPADIQFLIDDMEEQNKKDLDHLLQLIDHPLMEEHTYVLWKFTRALLKASYEKPWLKKDEPVQPNEEKEIVVTEESPAEIKITATPESINMAHDEIYSVNTKGERDLSLKFSKDITSDIYIPELPEAPKPNTFGQQEDIKIASVRKYPLVFDKETNKGLVYAEVGGNTYRLEEPVLTDRDHKILETISRKYARKIQKLVFDKEDFSKLLKKLAEKEAITYNDIYYVNMRYYVMRDNIFAGKVEPLMHDDNVKRIICDGVSSKVRIDYNGIPLYTNIEYATAEEINSMVHRLAESNKVKIDKKNPAFSMTLGHFRLDGNLGNDVQQPKFTLSRI